MLYCIVLLYCAVLYCTSVLCCTVLYCKYYMVLYCAGLHLIPALYLCIGDEWLKLPRAPGGLQSSDINAVVSFSLPLPDKGRLQELANNCSHTHNNILSISAHTDQFLYFRYLSKLFYLSTFSLILCPSLKNICFADIFQ